MRGIAGVDNKIEVRPHVAPVEIKRKIEEALRRSAELDASRITVETRGSEVILRGTVRSWAEREQAEEAAWKAPGVTKVDNRSPRAAGARGPRKRPDLLTDEMLETKPYTVLFQETASWAFAPTLTVVMARPAALGIDC